MTGDYWQVDGLRRELIRHQRDKRQYLHEMRRSDTTPVPKDQLDERETHIEYQKSKKKVLHKDSWGEKKRFSDKMEEFWKGKTIYKIKDDYEIPEDVVRSDIDRSKPFRGNIDDLFHPESASSYRPGVQKKPSSQKGEAGKSISKGPRLKKIEVGPPAGKRHVGKQKPKVVDRLSRRFIKKEGCCFLSPATGRWWRWTWSHDTEHSIYTLRSILYTLHFALHFTLETWHSSLHFALHTLNCTLDTLHKILHSTLNTLHSTHYTWHPTHYTLHTTLYTRHCTLYALHYTLHSPHSTLYTSHFYLALSQLYTFHT